MNKKTCLILLALFVFASPMFAQTSARMKSRSGSRSLLVSPWPLLPDCAVGPGESSRRVGGSHGPQSGASAAIRFALLLGLVLIESLALYTLVIIFAKLSSRAI
jgi:F-type H+-transporting ATPase subunit c